MHRDCLDRSAIRCLASVTLCACVLVVAFGLAGHAGQLRSITEGVYSATQATRGQQVYQAQCASCHGRTMEGTSGPPLAGNDFLANWSARPLAGLVDKIEKTMPFNLPGSLSRPQSIDLAAYILQVGKFPAGSAELTDGALSQTAFAMTRAPSTSTTSTEGNLAELMRAIAFPNANIIFNVQLKDPGAQPKKQPACGAAARQGH